MGADHREAVAERHDDRAVDAGDLRGEDDVLGQGGAATVEVVVPVDAEQVERVGGVAVDAGQGGGDVIGDARRVGQLRERGEDDALLAAAVDTALIGLLVDDLGQEAESADIEGTGGHHGTKAILPPSRGLTKS